MSLGYLIAASSPPTVTSFHLDPPVRQKPPPIAGVHEARIDDLIAIDPSTGAPALAGVSRSGFRPTGVLESATGFPVRPWGGILKIGRPHVWTQSELPTLIR